MRMIRFMDIKNLDEVPPFTTKDGSEIRELLAHRNSAIRNQSLAEARLPVGASTQEHYHAKTEEIYFITAGHGRIRIEEDVAEVAAGDAIGSRDHWHPCYFSLWAGAGVQPGRVVGESDARGEYPLTKPVTPAMVGATMLQLAGVSTAARAELGVLEGAHAVDELL